MGDWLVRGGLALDWPKYSHGKYEPAQHEAERAKWGMWAGSYVEPWVYRHCFKEGGKPGEVAFSPKRSVENDDKFTHYLVLDRLILEYPETIMWLGKHGGDVRQADYEAAERAVLVCFDEDFAKAERFFDPPGVRRALIAYWAEALADLRERNAKSVYARYHSYDAVSQLLEYKRERDRVMSVGVNSAVE